MKKILVTTSGICLLLGVTLRAEANFYVPNDGAQRCNLPHTSLNNNQSWQTPNIKEDPSKKCVVPISKPSNICPTKPICPTPVCPTPLCPTPVPKCDINSATASPVRYKNPTYRSPARKDQVVVIVYEGSLKNNVERILRENCWDRVIWKLPVDYRWIGTARIAGPDLATVMDTLLAPFPVEITFYHANHVAAINQRKYHE